MVKVPTRWSKLSRDEAELMFDGSDGYVSDGLREFDSCNGANLEDVSCLPVRPRPDSNVFLGRVSVLRGDVGGLLDGIEDCGGSFFFNPDMEFEVAVAVADVVAVGLVIDFLFAASEEAPPVEDLIVPVGLAANLEFGAGSGFGLGADVLALTSADSKASWIFFFLISSTDSK
ncbi:hypothetical protein WICPIJ_003907 [Wickerhamomyces pijperi]|uniref:Uncharacterized protein n=1 Tax=Wickerhamomyces pijperi TaxID=599730 RepID=A0A9P8Q8S0_WICPI|nr:hypothetical protein WICPIJ_003907 [Wickerhamomyces pijperi]